MELEEEQTHAVRTAHCILAEIRERLLVRHGDSDELDALGAVSEALVHLADDTPIEDILNELRAVAGGLELEVVTDPGREPDAEPEED